MAGPRACLEPCREAVYFLCHFPSGRPDRGLPGALPFGVRTFLPARRTCRDATRGGRLFHCGGLSKIRFRRSRGPPTGPGAAAAVSARLAAPSLRLARRTPRQETTRRSRGPPTGPGAAAAVSARLAAPSLRLARRTPRQETTRRSRGPPTGPGAASAVSARLAAPSSRLARRTPRQETTRRPRAGHRLAQKLLRRSQPAWLLPTRRHPVESDIAPASCTGCCEACRSPRPFSRCSSRAPEASPRETPARPPP